MTLSLLLLGLILLFLLFVLAVIVALRSEKSEKNTILGSLESVLFLVMMPQAKPQKEGEPAPDEKVIISQMEQVLANFLYLKRQNMWGPSPSIALEIASQTGGSDISFYVSVPKSLETVFEKYVQGVYPNAIVDKIREDYTVFEPQGESSGAYLKLKENFLFPLSTYKKLEKDPVASITNALSKIKGDEGAAIQIIIKPLVGFNLRKKGEKALSKIREGRHVRQAAKEALQSGFASLVYEIFAPGPKKKKEEEVYKQKEQGFDQAGYEAIQEKIGKAPFEADIRLISSAASKERADEILSHIISAFSQFSLSSANSLEAKLLKGKELK